MESDKRDRLYWLNEWRREWRNRNCNKIISRIDNDVACKGCMYDYE